jgi:hypothetical protein
VYLIHEHIQDLETGDMLARCLRCSQAYVVETDRLEWL